MNYNDIRVALAVAEKAGSDPAILAIDPGFAGPNVHVTHSKISSPIMAIVITTNQTKSSRENENS